jgi:hypothetical protein
LQQRAYFGDPLQNRKKKTQIYGGFAASITQLWAEM